MNIKAYFQHECNKRRVHIEQLIILRNEKKDDQAARRRVDAKIAREREQLALLDEVWDVK